MKLTSRKTALRKPWTIAVPFSILLLNASFASCSREHLLIMLGVADAPSSRTISRCDRPASNTREFAARSGDDADPSFAVVREALAWRGPHRSILSRTVELPGARSQEATFDVLECGHGRESVLVVAWDTKSRTATLIREFHPGPLEFQYGAVAGGVEPTKHKSPLEAAQFELEEEARLVGGTWVPLLESPQGTGLASLGHDKYSTERFFPWLVLDAQRVEEESARPRDDEECIGVVDGLTAIELRRLLRSGSMNCPSSTAVFLALDRLDEMGLLTRP